MATSIKHMNRALYNATFHLMEAGKHLSNVEEFREDAQRILLMADNMASIIQEEPEKVTPARMLSILDQILAKKETL
jgi:hypothetical protein